MKIWFFWHQQVKIWHQQVKGFRYFEVSEAVVSLKVKIESRKAGEDRIVAGESQVEI